jgi:alpha-D-ribose 1-methylphosphonate 5-triphosphate diphosphatase PhnM
MRRFRRRDILATTTALALGLRAGALHAQGTPMHPDLILVNGRFTTLDRANPNPEAVAITDGMFSAVGEARDILAARGPATKVIDLGGRRAIPGLIDSHIHVIRGGLYYNIELRWGWRANPRRCDGNAEAPGRDNASAAMGARGRRVHRASVHREAPADAR